MKPGLLARRGGADQPRLSNSGMGRIGRLQPSRTQQPACEQGEEPARLPVSVASWRKRPRHHRGGRGCGRERHPLGRTLSAPIRTTAPHEHRRIQGPCDRCTVFAVRPARLATGHRGNEPNDDRSGTSLRACSPGRGFVDEPKERRYRQRDIRRRSGSMDRRNGPAESRGRAAEASRSSGSLRGHTCSSVGRPTFPRRPTTSPSSDAMPPTGRTSSCTRTSAGSAASTR